MKTGVVYLNIGTKCLARLAVSAYSLRRHYGGPIAVVNARGHDGGIAGRIALDPRIDAQFIDADFPMFRRRTAYTAKPTMNRWAPFDRSLFLDADTLVCNDPSLLFTIPAPLVVTHFSDWTCNGGGIVRSRIKQFFNVHHPHIDLPELARRVIDDNWPAINTGVFVFDRIWNGMQTWADVTHRARHSVNFTDEIACQVLLPMWDHAIVGDEWNWSPMYGKSPRSEVGIIHFHGSKHLRGNAAAMWLPTYRECVDGNVGGIAEWSPAGDKALATLTGGI